MLSGYTSSSGNRQELKDIFSGPGPKYYFLVDRSYPFW
jgi:hypothetical protein